MFGLRRSDHITDALVNLHWLRIAERNKFKMAVTEFRALHGLPPSYLQVLVRRPESGRSGLRSVTSALQTVSVPRSRLLTVGDWSFPVAGAVVWNSLPIDITSVPNLSTFRSALKTFLFYQSFPGIVLFTFSSNVFLQ